MARPGVTGAVPLELQQYQARGSYHHRHFMHRGIAYHTGSPMQIQTCLPRKALITSPRVTRMLHSTQCPLRSLFMSSSSHTNPVGCNSKPFAAQLSAAQSVPSAGCPQREHMLRTASCWTAPCSSSSVACRSPPASHPPGAHLLHRALKRPGCLPQVALSVGAGDGDLDAVGLPGLVQRGDAVHRKEHPVLGQAVVHHLQKGGSLRVGGMTLPIQVQDHCKVNFWPLH